MSRTIKFRGKCLDNGEWVYGDLLKPHTGTRIVSYDESEPQPSVCRADFHYHNVDPATVGQFTGVLDKNGKEIYEGDAVIDDLGNKYEVCWYDDLACFMAEMICNERPYLFYDIEPNKCEVIGNIHDNPELLNEK